MVPDWLLGKNKVATKAIVNKIMELVNQLDDMDRIYFAQDLYFANQMMKNIDLSDAAVMRFKDLSTGEKFVFVPMPGDDSGQGGLKGPHYVFVKTSAKSAARLFDKTHTTEGCEDCEVFKLI